MTQATQAKIIEHGNGLVDAGDYVSANDGGVYRVVKTVGPIHTGGPGAGSYVYAEVELADWSDVDDDNEPTCSAVLCGDDD
jgi:hypothetical protein